MFANEEHIDIEVTEGVYQELVSAYADSDKRARKLAIFKVLKHINDNAYKIDISNSKHLVHDTFNVADLSPYYGISSDEEDQESRTTLFQGGEMM